MKEILFVYGTLKDPKVQKKVIGRKVESRPDRLKGYRKSTIKINSITYPILVLSPNSSVKGLVLSLTPKELKVIDEYETNAYRRIKVVLKSGIKAWVYIK